MEDKNEKGVMGSIFTGYFILLFHVLLILLLCLAIVFLRGFNEYLGWIVLGGLMLSVLLIYLFVRKMRQDNKKVRDIIKDPAFQGKSLEISFLGGMASLKIGQTPLANPEISYPTPRPQLEDAHAIRIRELTQIANLFENNLISQEEYDRLKKEILKDQVAE